MGSTGQGVGEQGQSGERGAGSRGQETGGAGRGVRRDGITTGGNAHPTETDEPRLRRQAAGIIMLENGTR